MHNNSPLNNFLSALDKVKQTGHMKWIACCPAHDDKTPSLAIREADDGRILIHCFGGCPLQEIVAAVGMDISDLFPRNNGTEHEWRRLAERRPFHPFAVLSTLSHEATIILLAGQTISRGEVLSDIDVKRVARAVDNIHDGLRLAGIIR